MQETTKTNHYIEDEIYLKDIFNQLIASKKLIIIITLLSTILAFSYSNSKPPIFKSNALIEIGTYNFVNFDESGGQLNLKANKALIESAKSLLSEVNIAFVHKRQSEINPDGFTASILEGRLIKIGITTPSIKMGQDFLNEITAYILKRHENIVTTNTQRNINVVNTRLDQINSEIEFNNERLKTENERLKTTLIEDIEANIVILNNEINNINAEIEFNNERLKTENKIKLSDTENRIKDINQLLPTIDKKINALKAVISEDTANLRLLETDPQLLKERAAIPPTLSEVIYLYKNSILDFESEKVSLKNALLMLQDSISKIKISLENGGDLFLSNYIADNIFKLSQEKISLENELLILQDSISKIKMALESESEDSIYLINEYLSSNNMTDKYIGTENLNTIFKLSQEKNIQEKYLQSLMAQTSSNSALIGEISSSQTNPKIIKSSLQGFIFGMILSFGLALIIGKFKTFKEENAITL